MLIAWSTVGIPLLSSILGSSLLIFSFTTFINTVYYIPDINIEVEEKPNATIQVKNIGRSPATKLVLTIETPGKIVNYNGNFSTENITITEVNQNILKIYAPRLIQGEGSIIKVFLLTNTKQNIQNLIYDVFATYDQGSIKYPNGKSDTTSILFVTVLSFAGIFSIVIPYIYLRIRKRIKFINSIFLELEKITEFFGKKIESNDIYFEDNHMNVWNKESNLTKHKFVSNSDDYKLLDKLFKKLANRDNKIKHKSKDMLDIDSRRILNEEIEELAEQAKENIHWRDYGVI